MALIDIYRSSSSPSDLEFATYLEKRRSIDRELPDIIFDYVSSARLVVVTLSQPRLDALERP